jgi:DNA-binding winged helix-turn-helix (wHTH) protein/pimeloyl-ACP methyl ester carboxylesterase
MIHRFDVFELDTDSFELRAAGRPVPLEPQVFDVLRHLVEHGDRLVTKEELLDAVWGNRFVSESALTSRIKAVRQALGDDGRTQRFVRTVHGRGYRFVARPAGHPGPAVPASPAPTATSSVARAVRPPARRPPVSYARSGGLNIAYQVTGEGPLDIVLVAGFVSHLELDWAEPRHAHFLDRLGTLGRLIRFDKRGTGLSDRPPGLPDLETRMDDLRAVMDAAGCEQAVLFGYSEGGPMSLLFAAMYPERCVAIVLYGTYARRLRTDDYPWAHTVEQRAAYGEQLERDWAWEADMRVMCPSADEALATWWGERCRAAASPGAARALIEMNSLVDVRHVLPAVHVPALVLHRSLDRDSRVEEGRYLADHLPSASFVELPGADHFVAIDPDQILDPVERFVTGLTPAAQGEWTLATVLAVSSDRPAIVVDPFHDAVARFRGTPAERSGEVLVAAFDGPARAVRCAAQVTRAAAARGVASRSGVHIGEVLRKATTLSGPAVDAAATVADAAGAGEVRVSQRVVDLLAGSGLRFGEPGPTPGAPGSLPAFPLVL